MEPSTEHARENRRYWNEMAHEWIEAGERNWQLTEPEWGIWSIPERELRLLPESMAGMSSVELGCGTGYCSAWMARRGARATGIDLSEGQIATAGRLASEHGLDVTIVHGDAERTPFDDESFDFALSEYGAALWCDPYAWIPEAARILRPGGTLVLYTEHPLVYACAPSNGDVSGSALVRSYFEVHRVDWRSAEVDPGGIEWTLPVSGWFELLSGSGFRLERLLEPRAPSGKDEQRFFATRRWARDYPSELAFVATRL